MMRFRKYLHEKALNQRLPDVYVVVFRWKVRTRSLQIESFHDTGQLLAHIVGLLQWSIVDEILIAPIGVLVT